MNQAPFKYLYFSHSFSHGLPVTPPAYATAGPPPTMLFFPRPKAPKSLKRAVSNGTPSWRRELAAFVDGGGSQHAPINGGGDTLLLLACRYGQSSVASLLAADADIEYANKVGHRALHEAVLSGDVATVAAVLAADADVDSQKLAGWTPLHLACTKRTPEAVAVVAQLLVHKAQPTLKNKDGWNACMVSGATLPLPTGTTYLHEFCSL